MVNMRSILTGLMIAGLMSTAAHAVTWDMPTPYPENNFHTVNIKKFAEDVKASTNGAVDIKVHSAGSLFKHPEIKNAVRSGQVPIGEFLLSRLANENAVFEVDSVPFLATGYPAAKLLWVASRPDTIKLLNDQGLTVLYTVPWPPQGLYTENTLGTVDDLKGLKFRAYNKTTETLATLAGAVPTQVEVPDIPQAFATGRVQAMITSPSTGANTKAWDFVKVFTDTRAWLPKNIVVVNKKAFARLAPATQTAILNAAQRAEDRGWEMSKAETEAQIAILKENGMKIDEPSAELVDGLLKIGNVMTDDWAKSAGAEGDAILTTYRKLLQTQ